jgi:DNA helicase-2/ATP-dependent DNA helicase PcrA
MHSAKGCEWDVVHVIHAADGMIPSDMAVSDQEGVDEELRLFYVALTRARNDLYVYFPLRYYHRRFGLDDPHSYGQLTRFLPERVASLFERTSLVIEQPDDPTGPRDAVGSVDAFLQRLWSA